MGRDTIQLENVVSTISQEYLLEFTSEYGIPESLICLARRNPLWSYLRAKSVFTPSFLSLQTFISLFHNFSSTFLVTTKFVSHNLWMSFSKRPRKNSPQCYTKPLGSLKNWSNRFFWVDEKVFLIVVDWRINSLKDEMPSADSYSAVAIATLNTRRTPIQKQPEALLCLVGLSQNYFLGDDVYPTFLYDDDRGGRVIDMGDTVVASGSSRTRAAIEKSPLDFADEDLPPVITERGDEATTESIRESGPEKEVVAMGHIVNKRRRKRGNERAEANAPPKVLRKDHVTSRPSRRTLRGKSLAAMEIEADSIGFAPATQETPVNIFQENASRERSRGLPPSRPWLGRQELRLRFEQEAKLLRKSIAQVARRDQRIEAREKHIRNLKALLEAEADMKGATEAKNVELAKELESLRIALSIDFDEEMYPHMLKAIAGRRWIIEHSLCLEVMKCAESTELRQVFADVVSSGIAKEHRKAKVDLAAIEAYNLVADTRYVAALHALKDLKYPLVNQLEKLKDAPIDVIMESLFLESDSREDAPQWIHKLRPSSSQLKISVYPEVRNPKDPWSFKDEILLEDAIAANVSRAKNKKKCRVVCRTHGVGSAHHASNTQTAWPWLPQIMVPHAYFTIPHEFPRLCNPLEVVRRTLAIASRTSVCELHSFWVCPSTQDDLSVNSVHGSCGVSITDAFGGASSGFSTRKSARIWPFTDVRGRLVSMTTMGCAWKYLRNLLAAQTSTTTSFSIELLESLFCYWRPMEVTFFDALLQGFEEWQRFFANLDRNLFRLDSFPLRLWTSLIVRGAGSCNTASVLSGHGFIPFGLIMYPRNIPSAAPN
nr:hypothetical protein [Tanacetum cinerariifolium]